MEGLIKKIRAYCICLKYCVISDWRSTTIQKYSFLKTRFFIKDFKVISGYKQVVNNPAGFIKPRISSNFVELLSKSEKWMIHLR